MSNEMKSGAPGRREAMKANAILRTICSVAAAGLAIGVIIERHACANLSQGNQALRQQLTPLDQIIAENQRLSNILAQPSGGLPRPSGRLEARSATDERKKEITRLRGEVETLRQQAKEIEALREDTRRVRAAVGRGLAGQNAGPTERTGNGVTGNSSQLEILQAEYWTDRTNMGVAAELRERIRGDRLKAVASNNLKGDPDFGRVKHLTVVYRFGGVIRTNQFREGDLVILPGE